MSVMNAIKLFLFMFLISFMLLMNIATSDGWM